MPIPPAASYISSPLHQRPITTASTLRKRQITLITEKAYIVSPLRQSSLTVNPSYHLSVFAGDEDGPAKCFEAGFVQRCKVRLLLSRCDKWAAGSRLVQEPPCSNDSERCTTQLHSNQRPSILTLTLNYICLQTRLVDCDVVRPFASINDQC